MDAFCWFVGEEPPHRYSLFGRLHPALLIHCRVQAHLVSCLSPSQRHVYQELWAQEILDGHQLPQYGMSRLMPPTTPAPSCLEDWDASDAEEGELAPAWEEVDPPCLGKSHSGGPRAS